MTSPCAGSARSAVNRLRTRGLSDGNMSFSQYNACPEFLACHKITGDADYILQVVAPNLDAYGEFVERVLRRQAGVASIQSSLALREVKYSSRFPIPDGA